VFQPQIGVNELRCGRQIGVGVISRQPSLLVLEPLRGARGVSEPELDTNCPAGPVRSVVFAGSLRSALRDRLDQPGANLKFRELAEIGGNVLGDLKVAMMTSYLALAANRHVLA